MMHEWYTVLGLQFRNLLTKIPGEMNKLIYAFAYIVIPIIVDQNNTQHNEVSPCMHILTKLIYALMYCMNPDMRREAVT